MRRAVSVSGFVLILALLAWPGVAAPTSTPTPKLVPPCHRPPRLPEKDTNRVVFGRTGLAFLLPKSFVRDSGFIFIEGGHHWTDHQRTFSVENSYWGNGNEPFGSAASPYVECVDSLAGAPFRLVITSLDTPVRSYVAAAIPVSAPWGAPSPALVGRSPVPEDLELFLSVFHSMRKIDR